MVMAHAPKVFGYLLAFSFIAFPFGAMLQERKAFRDVGLGFLGSLKAFLFIQVWMLHSAIAVMLQLPWYLMGYDIRKQTNTFYEANIGIQNSKVFMGPVKVIGEKNLPKDDKPYIYIANHQSMIDICVLYYLRKPFVWISKKAVGYIPGVGQIMFLSGHILLERKGKASIKQMYADAKSRLKDGFNIFIFPQGTRERTKILPFKHGAFSMAMSEEVDIVPVSIELSDDAWKRFFGYGFIWGFEEAKSKPAAILTVHPVMKTKDFNGDKEKMMKAGQEIIYSCLGDKKRM
ncbi:hypothetical protein TrVE_jg7623 [Triparma verrucosa]|uniref:Phospholipid/glycerol acyltransferase domain-containing protein n=1 Tax=Triparma verrucosa TaxID=1606542 RepID=A0A9W7F2W5_9STRA|nr:hypothetical protein TrVE_jg7623 [Triparma verrucosa]